MENEGQIQGLELVSPKVARRRHYGIAVFVCSVLFISGILIFFILQFALAKQEGRLDIGIKAPWYLRRYEWFANPEDKIELLHLPVANVLIGHSSTRNCSDKYSCIRQVLQIQREHQSLDWSDIGPNYLVGGDGSVLEGRGANVLGAMVRDWNRVGISVMFLGDYRVDVTCPAQFDNLNALIEELVRLKVLRADYVVFGHCQLVPVISPGPNVMNELHNFQHRNPAKESGCMPLVI